MKFFPTKLKMKMLGVIVLVVAATMVVSSLAVSYVIYGQNVDATNAAIEISAGNIKSKIVEMQEGHEHKIQEMVHLFDADEHIQFIGDFKADFDLMMTQQAFVELTRALFATASANGFDRMAIYDAQKELVAFSQQDGEQKSLVGFYYINPEKAFSYAQVEKNADIANLDWQTAAGLTDLEIPVHRPGLARDRVNKQILATADTIALSVSSPIVGEKYNKNTDKNESVVLGYVTLWKALDQKFVAQMGELTGMNINLFGSKGLAGGNLDAYTRFEGPNVPKTGEKGWTFTEQSPMLNEIGVDHEAYLQGVLPIYAREGLAGAITVLNPMQAIMDNTLQVVYVLIVVYACCLILIIPFALFVSGTIVKSLVRVTQSLKEIAQGNGDLTRRIEITSRDEIGELGQWFNIFVENLQSMIREISASSDALSGHANVGEEQAGRILKNANGMLDITQDITGSTENMKKISPPSPLWWDIPLKTLTLWPPPPRR